MASGFPSDDAIPDEKEMLELALEAARRANWDAVHGPRHLRAGRYLVLGEPHRAERNSSGDSPGAGGTVAK